MLPYGWYFWPDFWEFTDEAEARHIPVVFQVKESSCKNGDVLKLQVSNVLPGDVAVVEVKDKMPLVVVARP